MKLFPGICLAVAILGCLSIKTRAQTAPNCSVLIPSDTVLTTTTCDGIIARTTMTITHQYSGQCETKDQNGDPFPIGPADHSPTTLLGTGVCPFSPPFFYVDLTGTDFANAKEQWAVQNYKLVKTSPFDIGMVLPDTITHSAVLSCPATTCNQQCPLPAPNQSCTCDATNGNWVCPCQGTPVCGDGSQGVCIQGEWYCAGDDCTKTKQPNATCTCLGAGSPWVCACAGQPSSCSAGQQSVCYPPSWTCVDPNCIGNVPCSFCPMPAPNDSCACDVNTASWKCECQGSPGTCSNGTPQVCVNGEWQCGCQGSPTTCSDGSAATCINGSWTCGTVSVCAGVAPNDTCTCDSTGIWQCACQGSPTTCPDSSPSICVNGSWTCDTGSTCALCPPPCSDGSEPQCESGEWICANGCNPSDPTCGAGGGGGGGGGGECGCDPYEDPTCNPDDFEMVEFECYVDSASVSLETTLTSKLISPVERQPATAHGTSKRISKPPVSSHAATLRSKQK